MSPQMKNTSAEVLSENSMGDPHSETEHVCDASEQKLSDEELEHHPARLVEKCGDMVIPQSEISEIQSDSNLGYSRLGQMEDIKVSEEMSLPIDLPTPILESQNFVEYVQEVARSVRAAAGFCTKILPNNLLRQESCVREEDLVYASSSDSFRFGCPIRYYGGYNPKSEISEIGSDNNLGDSLLLKLSSPIDLPSTGGQYLSSSKPLSTTEATFSCISGGDELGVSDGNHPSEQTEDNSDCSDEETNIVGVNDKIDELARLSFNRYHMCFLISVVGRAGSGKTLVVREIFNRSQRRQHFDKRAFVSVSQNYEETGILAEIFQQVTEVKHHEKLSFEELQKKVRHVVARKRYLIVLDDVHTPEVWERLKYAFPNSLNGSRVILTIREANVASQIDRSFNTRVDLLPLTKDESWILFSRKVASEVAEFKHLKEYILDKCEGLPLMILVLGGLLASTEFSRFKCSKSLKLERIEAIRSRNGELDPLNILKLGYQDLHDKLQACLCYLCIFPRSYEIRVRRLFQLWIAEGLMGDPIDVARKAKDPEDVAKIYFKELKRRNMIEVVKLRSNGRPKACCVPDTLYDYLSSNEASKMGYRHIHGKSDLSEPHSIRSLAVRLDMLEMLPSVECHLPHLRSYLCLERGVWPAWEVGNFLNKTFSKRGFGLLKLLDLERVYEPVVPKKLGKLLPLLKYLGLRWTFLDSIPASVADLSFLETLDVKHTNITVLPVSISKAKKLRHLYLNDIHFEGGCPSELRTLWGLSIGNGNSQIIEWLKGLSGLRKLGLTCHESALESDWICKLGSLRILSLRSINEFGKPSDLQLGSMNMLKDLTDLYLLGKLPRAIDISQLPPKLRILTLSVSHLSQDPMPMLGKLEHLIVLKLLGNSYIGEQMICLQGGFPKLRVLKLWVLKMLTQWTVKEGTMPALRELEIRYCQKLMKKPDGFEKLTTLKELRLTNMDENFVVEVKECLAENAHIIKETKYDNVKWEKEIELKEKYPHLRQNMT